jgi:Protein of unknown function (DUF3352)
MEVKEAPTAKFSFKKPQLLWTAGAAAVLIGGGSIAYWFLNRQGQLNVMPTGANVIPQDAMMVISLSTDVNQWQNLREFGTSRSQSAFDQYLADRRGQIIGRQGINFEKDVKPWIGKEVTIAVLPPQAGVAIPEPGKPAIPAEQAPTVLVAPIADPLKAKELLEKNPATQGEKWKERKYKDVQVREDTSNPAQMISVAVLDAQQIVIANTPKAIERAIDAYKGGGSLAKTPGYGEALTQINDNNPFARVYFNVSSSAANSAGNASRQLPPQSLSQLQQMQGVAATATVESEGVKLKTVTWLKPDSKQRHEVQNNAKMMPNRLPSETLVMASGGNLKKFWRDFEQISSIMPVRLSPDAIKQGIQSSLGLDFNKDLLEWMQGEFSFSIVPTQQKSAGTVPLSYVFMTQATDRRTADIALKRFDEIMASRYTFKVQETKVSGQPVVNLTSDNVTVSRGWLDGDVAYLSLSVGAPGAPTFVPKPPSSLAENDQFRKTTKSDLKQNNGHFFTNVDRLIALKDFPLVQLLQPLRTGMEATQSIGITSAVTSDRTSRYDVFVTLKKGDRPGNLPSPK